jgi:hypothetical protein
MGVNYDTALRGVHHQTLVRDLGLLPVNRVTAAKAGAKKPRRAEGQRVEKSTHVEDRENTLPDDSTTTISVFAQGGTIGIGTLAGNGGLLFTPLKRVRTRRKANELQYRWYNDYELAEHLGRRTISVRLHGNDEHKQRKFNRTRQRGAYRRPRAPPMRSCSRRSAATTAGLIPP